MGADRASAAAGNVMAQGAIASSEVDSIGAVAGQ
jgi:hypothetical protein